MHPRGLTEDLEIAINAARAAGQRLLHHFGGAIEVTYKSPDQPVTAADLAADELLRKALLDARPEYGWISEEMTRDEGRTGARTWVVDPLDGTRNFIEGRGDFAVCVGLLEAGRPVLGVVYHPSENVTYSACMGSGAFRDGQRIDTSTVPPHGAILVASYGEVGRGSIRSLVEGELLLVGSTALKMMRVAEGRAHLYVSTTPKGIWDICAGAVIVAEAGGHSADLGGAPLRFNDAKLTRGLIVAGRGGEAEIARVAAHFASEEPI